MEGGGEREGPAKIKQVVSYKVGWEGEGTLDFGVACLAEGDGGLNVAPSLPAAASTIGRATLGSPATSGECGRSHCPTAPTAGPPSRTAPESR